MLLLGGCVAPSERGGEPIATADEFAPHLKRGRETAVRFEKHSNLSIDVTTPPTVAYDIAKLGPSTRTVSVRITNGGERPADITGLDVSFSASRNGVSFPCAVHPASTAGAQDPSWLPPGELFTFEKEIDCSMPLPGRYNLQVFTRFQEDSPHEAPDFVDQVTFEIFPGLHSPSPYPSRKGLYVAMSGDAVTRPLPPEGWARGDYHVVVAVINSTDEPIAVGTARLSFLTYKSNASLPCSGEAATLRFPAVILPGTMVTLPAPVTCAPSEQGIYTIVGQLTLLQAGDVALEIGKVDLMVTSDPHFFAPGLQLWPTELTR